MGDTFNPTDVQLATEVLKERRQKLAEQWKFSWPVMDVLIGGNSSIDLPHLLITSQEEATAFIESYGFDINREADLRRIHAAMIEALHFIEQELMPKEWAQGNTPPAELLNCLDPRQLLLWASDLNIEVRQRRDWSCALLRVMHTIFHIEGAFRYSSIDIAREQIMARFHKFIHRDSDGNLWLGDHDNRVALEHVEWKHKKSRQSILLKLLHKRANVAETIYDMIGVRIVTRRQSEVMQAVRLLRMHHIVSFPNFNPSRARNTLIDTVEYRRLTDDLRGRLMSGAITPEQFEMTIANIKVDPPAAETTNQHSARNYKSIQMTGRQLVRTINPNLGWLTKLKNEVCSMPPDRQEMVSPILSYITEWHGMESEIETSAFFPFEIQVMDAAAYAENSSGPASHGRYKRSQIRAARRRVLADILQLK